MTRVPRGLRPMWSLPAWLRTAALVAAVSAVLPWDALAHGKREHDSAAKTNSARHPAKHEPVAQTYPRRMAHGKAARPLPPPPAPSSIRRDDPLAPPWVIRVVALQATAAGLAPSLLLAVAWRESGFATTATPGNGSTAAGMFQFNEDAWLDAIRIYGPKHGLTGYASLLKLEDGGTTAVSDRARRRVLDLRRDVRISAAMAAETMVGERGELEDDLGRPTRPADLYFRHLLGPAGSRHFLPAVAATPSVSSEQFLGRIAHGNPIIFYRDGNPLSLGEAYANVAAMLDERMVMYDDQVRYYHVTSAADGEQRPPRREAGPVAYRHEARFSIKAHGEAHPAARNAKPGTHRQGSR
ncbi:MAG: transglycosylase SLT domain-containing protein [Rhodopila sp.]